MTLNNHVAKSNSLSERFVGSPFGMTIRSSTSSVATYIFCAITSNSVVLDNQKPLPNTNELNRFWDAGNESSHRVMPSLARDEFIKIQVKAVEESTHEWNKYLTDVNAPVDVDALTETIGYVFQTMHKYGAGAVNLCNVQSSSVNGEHLAAILRATSSVKNFTPGWTNALEVAKTALSNQGVVVEDALFGLI